MSDQNGTTTAEPTKEAPAITTDVLLKKMVRAFVKYPSADNYQNVTSLMRVMQRAYVAEMNKKFDIEVK